jgi:NAD(P)-dependent dehydrogenase (short-subunit alcohol dehydrogenase family)
MEFSNKRVLITGGTSGIGLSTAAAFLKEGASVCISGRSEESLLKAAAELEQDTDMVFGLPADISGTSGCKELVNEAVEIMGGLDILVNSAGVWLEGPAEDVTEDEWNMVMDTNLKGTFFMCRYAIPFLEESSGCIVNVSSDSGLIGNDLAAVYCASKGGVTLLTKSLAVELARKCIRVNAVCPGDVATPMLERAASDYLDNEPGATKEQYVQELLSAYPERPDRRFTRPDEVARSILFLSSDKVEAITGACLSIDFGLTAGY